MDDRKGGSMPEVQVDDGAVQKKLLTNAYVMKQLGLDNFPDYEKQRLLSLKVSRLPNGGYCWQVVEFLPRESLWSKTEHGSYLSEYQAEKIVEIGFEPELPSAAQKGAEKLAELEVTATAPKEACFELVAK
jgi:hypothetical protein